MFKASFQVQGNNYIIKSAPISVTSMEQNYKMIYNHVLNNGGTCREFKEEYFKNHEFGKHYNALRFRSEFFLEGIIITLSGATEKERKFLVNPQRSNLYADLRSGRGVCLSDVDEYFDYDRDRSLGLNQQIPELSDRGTILLSLEGAIKHLNQEAPEFHDVTGLTYGWKPRLELFTPEQFVVEQEKDKIKKELRLSKNLFGYSYDKAKNFYLKEFKKYPALFEEVWNLNKMKQISGK